MLNCVNALEHLPGTEQSGLVGEEKTQQDSFPNPFEQRLFRTAYSYYPRRYSIYSTVPAGSEHSSHGRDSGDRPPPPLPPPRFPNSAV